MMLLNRRAVSNLATTSCRRLGTKATQSSTIQSLQNAFRDPASPYFLPPGTRGPESPEPLSEALSPAEEGWKKLATQGWDPASFWEQKIVWGDHDSFQHVNNVRYVRFFESGRIVWMEAIGNAIGGAEKADQMLRAKGISLILKSIQVNYRRPVTYPDTLLIAHRAEIPPVVDESTPRTQFTLHATAYSLAQQAIVTTSSSELVWYDYDNLKKADPGQETWSIMEGAVQTAKSL